MGKRQRVKTSLAQQESTTATALPHVNSTGSVAGGAHHVTCQRLSDLLVVDGGLGLAGHLAGDRHGLVHVQHHDLE